MHNDAASHSPCAQAIDEMCKSFRDVPFYDLGIDDGLSGEEYYEEHSWPDEKYESFRALLKTFPEADRIACLTRIQDYFGTVLHWVADCGYDKMATTLVEAMPPAQRADYLRIKNADDETALYRAARMGNTDTVAALIAAMPQAQRADYLRIKNGDDNNTALHIAAEFGETQIVALLLEAMPAGERTDYINMKNADGETVLALASRKRQIKNLHPSTVDLLEFLQKNPGMRWTSDQIFCFATSCMVAARMPRYLFDKNTKKIFDSVIDRDDKSLPVQPAPFSTAQMRKQIGDNINYGDIKDMVQEVADCLLLPALAMKTGGKIDPLENRRLILKAWELVPQHGDFLDIAAWSQVWHRNDKAIPRSIRDKLPDRQWHPLFVPKTIDFPPEAPQWRVCCLTTDKELEKEGATLNHCVGRRGYGNACADGETHIVAVRRLDENGNETLHSTAQIGVSAGGYKVEQHVRANNIEVKDSDPEAKILAVTLDNIEKNPVRYGETQTSIQRREKENISPIVAITGFEPSLNKLLDIIHHYQKEIRYASQSTYDRKSQGEPENVSFLHKNTLPKTKEKSAIMHSLLGPVRHYEVTEPSQRPLGEKALVRPETILHALDTLLDPYIKEKYGISDPVSLESMYEESYSAKFAGQYPSGTIGKN